MRLLARRNPRWRVALWRSAVVGLALVAILSGVHPIVTYRLVFREQPSIKAEVVRGAPEIDTIRSRAGTPGGRRPSGTDPSHPRSDISGGLAGVAAGEAGSPAEVSPDDSAIRDAQGFRWNASLVSGLWTIWLAGVFVLIARLIVGSRSLAWIVRRASEAPDAIVREGREVADRLGCRQSVRMRSNPGHRDALPGGVLASRPALDGTGV